MYCFYFKAYLFYGTNGFAKYNNKSHFLSTWYLEGNFAKW